MAAESNRTAGTIAIRRGIGLTSLAVMLTAGLTSGRAPGFGLATVHAQLQARHIDITDELNNPMDHRRVRARRVATASKPGAKFWPALRRPDESIGHVSTGASHGRGFLAG